jgi:hypothetical protein
VDSRELTVTVASLTGRIGSNPPARSSQLPLAQGGFVAFLSGSTGALEVPDTATLGEQPVGPLMDRLMQFHREIKRPFPAYRDLIICTSNDAKKSDRAV